MDITVAGNSGNYGTNPTWSAENQKEIPGDYGTDPTSHKEPAEKFIPSNTAKGVSEKDGLTYNQKCFQEIKDTFRAGRSRIGLWTLIGAGIGLGGLFASAGPVLIPVGLIGAGLGGSIGMFLGVTATAAWNRVGE